MNGTPTPHALLRKYLTCFHSYHETGNVKAFRVASDLLEKLSQSSEICLDDFYCGLFDLPTQSSYSEIAKEIKISPFEHMVFLSNIYALITEYYEQVNEDTSDFNQEELEKYEGEMEEMRRICFAIIETSKEICLSKS